MAVCFEIEEASGTVPVTLFYAYVCLLHLAALLGSPSWLFLTVVLKAEGVFTMSCVHVSVSCICLVSQTLDTHHFLLVLLKQQCRQRLHDVSYSVHRVLC